MNKKEVLEIRKQFSPANCSITRICGCYVDHEKEKKALSKNAFLSLPEEEAFKYFDIFKKTLSGTPGKNLLNMEFSLEQEKPDSPHAILMKLRESKLDDEILVEEFYDKIIDHLDYPENYYIVLIHAIYDVPGKANDGSEMFDASDNVYEHILCSVCPVKLSKPGLSYNAQHNSIEDRIRDWVVEMPMQGFLFPAFHDRNSDIHSILYYSKNADEIQPGFIDNVLGSSLPMTASDQKESFHSVIMDTLGSDCDYEVMKNIHENFQELIEEHKENPDPVTLAEPEIKRLLKESGAPEEKLERLEEEYEHAIGQNTPLMVENIASTRKFQVETPDVEIKVNPERTDLIETRVIDGRKYIMIAADEYIEVNGVPVKTVKE